MACSVEGDKKNKNPWPDIETISTGRIKDKLAKSKSCKHLALWLASSPLAYYLNSREQIFEDKRLKTFLPSDFGPNHDSDGIAVDEFIDKLMNGSEDDLQIFKECLEKVEKNLELVNLLQMLEAKAESLKDNNDADDQDKGFILKMKLRANLEDEKLEKLIFPTLHTNFEKLEDLVLRGNGTIKTIENGIKKEGCIRFTVAICDKWQILNLMADIDDKILDTRLSQFVHKQLHQAPEEMCTFRTEVTKQERSKISAHFDYHNFVDMEDSSDEECQSDKMPRGKKKSVTFKLFIPSDYGSKNIKKVSCQIYNNKYEKKEKLHLNVSPVCGQLWTGQCTDKVKERLYTYSVKPEKEKKIKQMNKNHNILQEQMINTNDIFSIIRNPEKIDTYLSCIILKIMDIDVNELSIANECVAMHAVLEVLRKDGKIEMLEVIISDMLNSGKLSEKQTVLCIAAYSFILEPTALCDVVYKLGYRSDLKEIIQQDDNHLIVSILMGIVQMFILQKVHKSIEKSILGKKESLKRCFIDKMRLLLLEEIKHCQTPQDLQRCCAVMFEENIQSATIFTKVHNKIDLFLQRKFQIDIFFLERIVAKTSVAWESLGCLLGKITQSDNLQIWKIFVFACNSDIDFVKDDRLLTTLCQNWIRTGLNFHCEFDNRQRGMVPLYGYLYELIKTKQVKRCQNVVSSCKEQVKKFCLEETVGRLFNSAEHIDKGENIFWEHAKEIILVKTNHESLAKGMDLSKVLESLQKRSPGNRSSCIHISKSITASLLGTLVSEVFTFMEMKQTQIQKAMFLVSHSKFWKGLISATGPSVNEFLKSEGMCKIIDSISQHANLILRKEITLGDYSDLVMLEDATFDTLLDTISCFQSFNCNHGGNTNCGETLKHMQASWKAMQADVEQYKRSHTNIKCLIEFVHSLKSDLLYSKVEEDLRLMKKIADDTIKAPIHEMTGHIWRTYGFEEIERFANENIDFINLKCFHNFVCLEMNQFAKEESDMDLKVEEVCNKIFATCKGDFDKFMEEKIFGGTEDTTIIYLEKIFDGVSVETELNTLAKYYPSNCCRLREPISTWIKKTKICDVSEKLVKLVKLCGIKCEELEKDLFSLEQLDNTKLILADYWSQFAQIIHEIDALSPNVVKLIEEVASSNILMPLLKDVTNDYLPDLLMCVDEFAASFMNENTVKALINLKQYLQPLLDGLYEKKITHWEEILNCINNIMSHKRLHETAPSLAETCAKSASGLKELYRKWSGSDVNVKEFVKQVMLTERITIERKDTNLTITLLGESDNTKPSRYEPSNHLDKLNSPLEDDESNTETVSSRLEEEKHKDRQDNVSLDTTGLYGQHFSFCQLKEYKSKVMLHKKTVWKTDSQQRNGDINEERQTEKSFSKYLYLVKTLENIEHLLMEIHECGHFSMTDISKDVSSSYNHPLDNMKHQNMWVSVTDMNSVVANMIELNKKYSTNIDFHYLLEDKQQLMQNMTNENEISIELTILEQKKQEWLNESKFAEVYGELKSLNKFRKEELSFISLLNALQCLEKEWSEELENWKNHVKEIRTECEYFNYIHGAQFTMFYQNLYSPSCLEKCLSVIKYIFPGIAVTDVHKFHDENIRRCKTEKLIIEKGLKAIKRYLVSLSTHCAISTDSGDITEKSNKHRESGPVIIKAHYTVSSVISLVAEVFQEKLPKANEILFCQNITTKEEIEIFFSRFCRSNKLHCLANIQNLSDQQQHYLFDFLQSQKLGSNLVIIFRGNRQYALSDDSQTSIKTSYGMNLADLEDILKNRCQNVLTLTSEIPGLGKTEFIHSKAAELGLKVKTIFISGKIERPQLLQSILECGQMTNLLLHFDIKDVAEKEVIEIFLFELLVLGSVSAGPFRVHPSPGFVAIEIESTNRKSLQTELPITCLFNRIHIPSFSFENLLVSNETLSPIQIVANYIKAHDDNYLDHKTIHHVEPLKQEEVREICKNWLSNDIAPLNFCMVNSFIQMLSNQLLQFSKNYFLTVENVKYSVRQNAEVRSQIFSNFWSICKDITGMDLPMDGKGLAAEEIMLARAFEMKKWEDSNHFVAMFHVNDCNLLTPLYRDVNAIPTDVKKLFEIEAICFGNAALPKLDQYSHEKLEIMFREIVGFQNITQNREDKKDQLQKKKCTDDNTELGQLTPNKIQSDTELFGTPCLVASVNASINVTVNDKEQGKTMPGDQNLIQDVQVQGSKLCEKSKFPLPKNLKKIAHEYSLTSDNILKMALILLRVKARVPVILMGETGCGKTTLIQYLATTIGADISVINLHGGTSEKQLVEEIQKARTTINTCTEKWIFFDEINTCDHMGILSEVLCHRNLYGEKLEENLVFLAACNPYKLRKRDAILSAGLTEKVNMSDPLSQFVYRVHPLPEIISEYVWDYGNLVVNDEKSYMKQMLHVKCFKDVAKMLPEIVDVVFKSHVFLRNEFKTSHCVSLRDVSRFRELTLWFIWMLSEKYKYCTESYKGPAPATKEFCISAICHSLSICYKIKLTREKHMCYWQEIAGVIEKEASLEKAKKLENYVTIEQEDILQRLQELPKDIGKTSSLQENVFTLFVSIFSRTPVFLLGKPGCSKSLSIHLLKKSLLGKDSQDSYFQTLPQIIVVPYQASAVSTSRGIEAVFLEAKKYVPDKTFLPVVLLDEIGLAEASPENPLKVLHNLLDKLGNPTFDLAVIGISNWALDAAKMNRAIYLSVGDLTDDDLCKVAIQVSKGILGPTKEHIIEEIAKVLREIVFLFYRYLQHELDTPHFYGARDFYAFVKYIAAEINMLGSKADIKESLYEIALKGIQRNLGGLEENAITFFSKCLQKKMKKTFTEVPIKDLIFQNLHDRMARHLMIICDDETTIDFVHEYVQEIVGSKCRILIGSKFPGDQNDEYHYSVLRQVIYCMENGLILILKDLDRVYGSLYDMLNQSFTTRGNTNMCRIALDSNSNAGCVVHRNFKCIVMTTTTNLDKTDPPFLNRFEKQIISSEIYLSYFEKNIFQKVNTWVGLCSRLCPFDDQLTTVHAFPGYTEAVCQSLVSQVAKKYGKHQSEDLYITKCKEELLQTMPPDAILRLSKSELAEKFPSEVFEIQEAFFRSAITIRGFSKFMQELVFNTERDPSRNTGLKLIAYTHSNIFTNIQRLIKPLQDEKIVVQTLKLSAFQSAEDIMLSLDNFMSIPNESLLIVQMQPSYDKDYITLLRHLIDESLCNIVCLEDADRVKKATPKHICLLFHLDKRSDYKEQGWRLSYFGDWKIYTIDQLSGDIENYEIEAILSSDINKVCYNFHNINDSVKQNLAWAFLCLKYTNGPVTGMIQPEDIGELAGSEILIGFLAKKIIFMLKMSVPFTTSMFYKENWQIIEACTARGILQGVSLFNVWRNYLERNIQIVLAYIVYLVAHESAWISLVKNILDESFVTQWVGLAESIIQVTDLPSQIGPQSLDVCLPILAFNIPFCRIVFKELQSIVENMKTDLEDLLLTQSDEIDGEGDCQNMLTDKGERYNSLISRCLSNTVVGKYAKENITYFIEDIYNEMTAVEFLAISEQSRIEICTQCTKVEEHPTNTPEEKLRKSLLLFLKHEKQVRIIMSMVQNCLAIKAPIDHWFIDNKSVKTREIESFITQACHTILPKAQKLDSEDAIIQWQQQTATFLSLANQAGYNVALAELLKLFHDIINVVYIPWKQYDLCSRHLGQLEEEASKEKSVFESMVFLKAAFAVLGELPSRNENPDAVNQFKCLYYGRCVANSDDNPLLSVMLQDMKQMEYCVYIGTVLHQIIAQMDNSFLTQLLHEMPQDDHVYIKILNKSVCVKEIGPWEITMCDVLHKEAFTALEENSLLKLINNAYSIFHSASKLILNEDINDDMLYITSCAFIKKYMNWIAAFLTSSGNIIDKAKDILIKFNKIITDFSSKKPYIFIYFLQCLKVDTFYDLQQKCEVLSCSIPLFKDVTWSKDVIFYCAHNPFAMNPDFAENNDRILQKVMANKEAFDSSFKDVPSLLARVATSYYLPRFGEQRPFNEDMEYQQIEMFLKEHLEPGKLLDYNKQHCQVILKFLNCLLGKRNFSIPFLNPQRRLCTTERDIAMFSVKLAHFFLLIQTKILQETSIKNSKVLMVTKQMLKPIENDILNGFNVQPNIEKQSFTLGKCSNHKVLYCVKKCEKMTIARCSKCDRPEKQCVQEKDYIFPCLLQQVSQSEKFVQCFAYLMSVCSILIGFAIQDHCDQSKKIYLEAIQTWNKCKQLSGCKDNTFTALSFILLDNVKDLFCNDIKTDEEFDEKFKSKINKVLSEKKKYILRAKFHERKWRWHGVHNEYYDRLIDRVEVDNEQLQETWTQPDSSLFMFREEPSIPDLKANFGMAQSKHNLVKILLDMENQLCLLRSLPCIMKWVVKSHSVSNKVMLKENAEKKSVENVLENVGTDMSPYFEAFSVAWNNLVDDKNWNVLKQLIGINEISSKVNGQKKFIHCIIPKEKYENNVIFKVVQALRKIQNTFLVKVLQQCTSLDHTASKIFGYKENASVETISVERLSEKNVLVFNWEEDWLNFSQHSTELFQECSIHYDLTTIENEIAMEFLPGKCILEFSEDTFPFVVFKDDMYHPGGELLRRMNILYPPQIPMPESVKGTLNPTQIGVPADVCDNFMFALEILLSALEENKPDSSQTLASYFKLWFSQAFGMHDYVNKFEEVSELNISHIVSFYEYIEENVSLQWERSIDKDYKCKLVNVPLEDLDKFLCEEVVSCDIFLKACQKVFVRHIVKPHPLILHHKKPSEGLHDMLCDKNVWPISMSKENLQKIENHIPKSLAVRHITETIKYVREHMQAKVSKIQKTILDEMKPEIVCLTKRKPKFRRF